VARKYLNVTRIRSAVRREYGRVVSESFLSDLEWLLRQRIKSKVADLKKVTTWADNEAEEQKQFGGKLLQPRCWKCRERKPPEQISKGVCYGCIPRERRQ